MEKNQEMLYMNDLRDTFLACIRNTDISPSVISMNAARIAFVLWSKILKYNPLNPSWYTRDRFVISAGVNAIIHYAMLHLSGYEISWKDLKNYRQLNSLTPGHPEAGHTPGIEVTVGSFGAAIASAVGMAMAERHLAGLFNRSGYEIINNYTYVIAYDGDLQEGVFSEAASMAGYLKLGKLIVLFNNNSEAISRRGFLQEQDNISERFSALGWSVYEASGDESESIAESIDKAKADIQKPSIIIVSGCDENELAAGNPSEDYEPPSELYNYFHKNAENGRIQEYRWMKLVSLYRNDYPEEAKLLQQFMNGDYGKADGLLEKFLDFPQPVSTSYAAREIVSALSEKLPSLFGGACELMPNSDYSPINDFTYENPAGKIVRFGNREQSMGFILNGISRYGGVLAYGTAFLVLSDYMRPSVRIAAMMGCDVVYIMINDSVWNGQDGPTHQPTEQIAAWRTVPGLTVIRPADALETAEAWKYIMEGRKGPVVLSLSKIPLPILTKTREKNAGDLTCGAYVLYESKEGFEAILLATGSEVYLAQQACEILESRHIGVRLVNMPSWELFEMQDDEYRQSVLPESCQVRVSVEAGCVIGGEKHTGADGINMGLNNFGLSAPKEELMSYFGLTPEQIANTVVKVINRKKHYKNGERK